MPTALEPGDVLHCFTASVNVPDPAFRRFAKAIRRGARLETMPGLLTVCTVRVDRLCGSGAGVIATVVGHPGSDDVDARDAVENLLSVALIAIGRRDLVTVTRVELAWSHIARPPNRSGKPGSDLSRSAS